MLRFVVITCIISGGGIASSAAQQNEASSQAELNALETQMAAAQERRAEIEAEAQAVAAEIAALTARMIDLAKQIQDQETSLTRVEIELDVLEDDLSAQRATLELKRKDLGASLAAMQKLSRQPASLVFLRPVSAKETSQSAALLSGVIPALNEQAARIRSDMATLEAFKIKLNATQATYRDALATLDDARGALEQARTQRQTQQQILSAEAQAEAERIAQLAGEAKTLSGLLERIRQERRKIASTPRPKPRPKAPPAYASEAPAPLFSESRGRMPLPVRGQVIGNFGKTFDGQRSAGLWIAARPQAQVIAPYDGHVVFADTFRSYGRLLIIEHSEGYHSVIAGLKRADVSVGQYIVAGEPVGIMGETSRQAAVPNNPLGLPVLYLELQRNGRSINPGPWLAANLESRSR
ncbi:MAG: peptidoglycan DD-metalloendopeptidase family protein [Pseudomonadota bacterium]